MENNEYLENSEKEIIKLKEDLISSRHFSDHSNEIFFKKNSQIKNEETGLLFEDNIRQSLKYELNWEFGELERHFFYREIYFDKTAHIIKINQEKEITVLDAVYRFKFNEDLSLEIINKDGIEKPITITEKNNDVNILYKKKIRITISKPIEMEIDGSFSITTFDYNLFKHDEIDILFNGVKKEEMKLFNYAVIEIKLNEGKITELIAQIKRDKNIIEKIINKSIIYLGFVKSKNLNIDISEEAKNLNLIIFRMKGNSFFGRNITYFIDWNLIQKTKGIFEEIQEIKKDVSFLLNVVHTYQAKLFASFSYQKHFFQSTFITFPINYAQYPMPLKYSLPCETP